MRASVTPTKETALCLLYTYGTYEQSSNAFCGAVPKVAINCLKPILGQIHA